AVGDPEVVDPSTQEPVELLDLLFHAHAVVSRSELPHTIFEALDALGMNRYVLRVDDKAQKGHTPVYVRDVRLLAVHREFQILLEDLHRGVPVTFSLSGIPRTDQYVVRIADNPDAQSHHPLVSHIQIDVAQQWRDHPTLGATDLRLLPRSVAHHARLEELPYQVQNTSVADTAAHPIQDQLVVQPVEAFRQVHIDYVLQPVAIDEQLGLRHGRLTGAPGSVRIA